MIVTGPPLTLISIVKPKRGVGSHVEKGWDPPGPTASHRTRFGSHVEDATPRTVDVVLFSLCQEFCFVKQNQNSGCESVLNLLKKRTCHFTCKSCVEQVLKYMCSLSRLHRVVGG